MIGLAVFLFVGFAAAADTPQPPVPVNVEKANRLREDLREMITLARDRVFPALVNIRVITVRYWDGKEYKGQSAGSGTIISREGHVLTNYHVARNGRKFTCTLADKQEIGAELVGEDPLTDLAVLKLNLSELKDPDGGLPVASFGNSRELEVGDTVMAMGSPWSLSRSVTLGIVSNTERVLTAGDDDAGGMRFDEDQRTGIFNRWIQHDAAINPGNSGGPLVNLKGEIVGVNTRGTFLGGDMGFAIPSELAAAVAEALIRSGEVPRSWWGLSFQSIRKSGYDEGVLLNTVEKDGPADKAGLEAGDVLLRVDDRPITILFPEEIPPLLKELADFAIGSRVTIVYRREGETATTELITEKLTRDRGDEAAFRAWGMVAVDITENMARARRLESTDGVLVDSVRSGNPAAMAEPSIAAGDVLRAIDGEPVRHLKDLIERYEKIMERDPLPEYLLIEFDRRGKNHLTLLKPRPDDDQPPPREVPKAWIGVAVQPVVQRLAAQLGRPEDTGFRVTRVYPGTAAAERDLQAGDIVVALNGERLRPRGMQDAGLFHREVRRLSIGDTAKLSVIRDGDAREIDLVLERTRITSEEAHRERNRDFELTVRELTFFDRDESRWDESVNGVIVESVESAGWAGLGGIRSGDLILQIDGVEIGGLADYRRTLTAVTERKPERVIFVVLRGPRTFFQYIEPEWHPIAERDDPAD